MPLPRIIEFAQSLMQATLRPGDLAVDATVGNGYDTCRLAEGVGAGGRVYGFDVQAEAVARTHRRLADAGLADRVVLVREGHERLRAVVPAAWHGRVRLVTFNLGYLPGGTDRTCVTRPETTCAALAAACDLLAPGGVVSVVLYPGHTGGAEEARAVEAWAAGCDARRFQVVSYRLLNQPPHAPYAVAVERSRGAGA